MVLLFRMACLSAVIAGLSACGFRLAGDRPMPETLHRVHVDLVAPYRVTEPPVESTLRTLLGRRGAQIAVTNAGGFFSTRA